MALSVLDLSWSELLEPLSYNQAAPPGFLALTKAVMTIAGGSELAFRFLPLLAGLVSVYIFLPVARKLLNRRALALAIFLFGISGPLVYYSAEFKQYSLDLAICLALTWLFFFSLDRPCGKRSVAALIAAGSVAVWFSHASVFVLFAGGVVLEIKALRERSHKRVFLLMLVGGAWLFSFAVLYVLNLRHIAHNRYLQDFWGYTFMPFDLRAVSWTIQKTLELVANPVGLSAVGLALVCFVWGLRDLFGESPEKSLILVLPILTALLASAAHRYPFSGRFLLFTVPAFLVCMARGASQIMEHARNRARWLGIAFLALLLFRPSVSAVRGAVRGPQREEIRQALEYLCAEAQAGDRLYVYYGARNPFLYYSKRMDLPDLRIIYGEESRDNWGGYKTDLRLLRGGGRVWLLFSHVYRANGANERKLILHHCEDFGSCEDKYKTTGASAYLFHFPDEHKKLSYQAVQAREWNRGTDY